jgi:phosphomannomutase
VIPVNCEPDGLFPRGAEPLPENLSELSRQVTRYRADIGLAQDPDADRLAVVDEKGNPIGEEYTIALVVDHFLKREKGRVVVNLSTTKAVEDIARNHGVPFSRAMVGEINVVKTMKKLGAVIGGEGNGGVISPEVHYGRDSLAGICYLLEMLAEREATVSQLVSRLPHYSMKKGKVSYDPSKFSIKKLEKITRSFRGEKISDKDGLRIDFIRHQQFRGGWVHLRPSNTEPVFRIIAEGKDQKQMKEIYAFFSGIIS